MIRKTETAASLNLFDSYREARKSGLSFSQFIDLVHLYPSLVVCMLDDVPDKGTWRRFLKTVRSLGIYDAEGSDVEVIYQRELEYLTQNAEIWHDWFLRVLKDYISKSDQQKDFVLESMYLLTNAVRGISETEMKKIEILSQVLALTS